MIDPTQDGKTHINLSHKALTFLGRFLDNRTLCELNMPEGRFLCVAAYWYYLTTKGDERLFKVRGWEAELLYSQLTPLPKKLQLPTEEFQQKIKKAIDQKLKWSDYWLEEFTNSNLLFMQYKIVDGKVIDESKKYKWFLQHLEARRTLLKQRKQQSA